MALPRLLLALLFLLCFGLAGELMPRLADWGGDRRRSGSLLNVLLGDSRRMFANHFFVKADVYFHSGYYPSIFDRREAHQTPHMAEDAGAMESKNAGEEATFLGPPRDWIDRFSRSFYPSEHTHLDQGGAHDHSKCKHDHDRSGHVRADGTAVPAGLEREMLPWLRIAAELDPHRVETYTVTAYWLRTRLGNVKAAEEFLRDGLRANPDSHEILFELGRLYYENRNDADRARNVWLAAVRKFEQQAAAEPEPDWFPLQQLLVHLARLEETEGHLDQAIHHLERLKPLSPAPVEIQKHIDLLSARSKPTALGPPPR